MTEVPIVEERVVEEQLPQPQQTGVFVIHQGGTHSQVGTVQSHRILSMAADNPELTSSDLPLDARRTLTGEKNVHQGPSPIHETPSTRNLETNPQPITNTQGVTTNPQLTTPLT